MSPDLTALTFTALLGFLALAVPRRLAAVPFLFGTIFIPTGVPVVIGALNLFPFRLLILCAWLRLLTRGEFKLDFRGIDKWVLAAVAVASVTYTLLYQTSAAFVNSLGSAFNAIGAYFFLRCAVRDVEDVKRVSKALAAIAMVVGLSGMVERLSARNFFYVLGGVTEFTMAREGAIRAQGPFGHAILAGTFGATLFALVAALWHHPGGRKWAIFGGAACVLIVVNSASSGPVLTLMAAVIGISFWPLRAHMSFVRRSVVATLVVLHLVMKAPVWALIGRVSVFGGSSADHRYRLIDGFVYNFSQWWLVGTKSYGEWGWVLSDVSNNYVRIGVDGGLITLVLFFCVVVACFRRLGRARRAVQDRRLQKFVWGIGVALFAHLVAFMGVNYWDQMNTVWYVLLSLIACVAGSLPLQTGQAIQPATIANDEL